MTRNNKVLLLPVLLLSLLSSSGCSKDQDEDLSYPTWECKRLLKNTGHEGDPVRMKECMKDFSMYLAHSTCEIEIAAGPRDNGLPHDFEECMKDPVTYPYQAYEGK